MTYSNTNNNFCQYELSWVIQVCYPMYSHFRLRVLGYPKVPHPICLVRPVGWAVLEFLRLQRVIWESWIVRPNFLLYQGWFAPARPFFAGLIKVQAYNQLFPFFSLMCLRLNFLIKLKTHCWASGIALEINVSFTLNEKS